MKCAKCQRKEPHGGLECDYDASIFVCRDKVSCEQAEKEYTAIQQRKLEAAIAKDEEITGLIYEGRDDVIEKRAFEC